MRSAFIFISAAVSPSRSTRLHGATGGGKKSQGKPNTCFIQSVNKQVLIILTKTPLRRYGKGFSGVEVWSRYLAVTRYPESLKCGLQDGEHRGASPSTTICCSSDVMAGTQCHVQGVRSLSLHTLVRRLAQPYATVLSVFWLKMFILLMNL